MDTSYSVWRAKKKTNISEVQRLRKELHMLKSFPGNFRDADPTTVEWQAMLSATSAAGRETMLDWAKGSVLYCQPLTDIEKTLLGPERLIYVGINEAFKIGDPDTHFEARLYQLTLQDIDRLCQVARDCAVSFIYVSNLQSHVLHALNTLLSYGNETFRFRKPITTEQGHTPGL
jgi:hypothetical protein